MSNDDIQAITMPKWGLSMTEGKIIGWLVGEGDEIKPGDPILDVETDKIASAVEATRPGTLRRKTAAPDQIIPVGGLLGVCAGSHVSDADIDNFVSTFVVEKSGDNESDAPAGPHYEWAQSGAHRVRYLLTGSGPETVLLVHGFGGDLDNWLFNQEPLAEAFRVLSLDLPGHGQSSKAPVVTALTDYASTITQLLDHLHFESVHAVGHSMGGAIVQKLAQLAPERVRSLTLIASAGLGPEINGGYIQGFVKSENARQLKIHLQALFGDPAMLTRRITDDILKYKRLDGVTAALEAAATAICDGDRQANDLAATTAALGKPTLVVWGGNDQVIPCKHAQSLESSASVHVLEGKGHMVQMEAAQQINGLIREFIDAVR